MVHAPPTVDLPSHDHVPVLPLDPSAYQIYLPSHYAGMGICDGGTTTTAEVSELLSAVSPSRWVGFRDSHGFFLRAGVR